jgi:DNA gyrase subunit A
LIDIQTSERNGPVVAVCKVTEDDEVMLTTNSGMVIRTALNKTRTIGRNTQGVRLIKLDEGDVVSSLAKLPEDELGDGLELAPATANGDEEPANGLEGSAEPAESFGDADPDDPGETDAEGDGDSNAEGLEESE